MSPSSKKTTSAKWLDWLPGVSEQEFFRYRQDKPEDGYQGEYIDELAQEILKEQVKERNKIRSAQ